MKQQHFKTIAALVAAAAFLLCATGFTLATPAQSARNLYATTKAVNVRSGPGTDYPVVGTLGAGSYVTKVGQSSGWARIKALNDRVAFVPLAVLRYAGEGTSMYCPDEAITYATSQTLYTTAALNIRSGPGTSYSIVQTLNAEEAVTAIGVNGDWSMVKLEETVGYAYTAYLTEEQPQARSYYTIQTLATTSNFNHSETEDFICYMVSSSYIIPISAAADADSAIVGYMQDDPADYIEVLNLSTNWIRINYHDTIGYVPFDLVTVYRIYRQIH